MIVQGEIVGRWVCEKAGGSWTHICQAIGLEKNNKLVAGIMYDAYTGASIMMSSRIDNPELVTREWLYAIVDYPFNKLNVKRVSAITNVNNHKAIKANEHWGFKREHVLRDYFPDGDAILYCMFKDECRWLKLGNRYGIH